MKRHLLAYMAMGILFGGPQASWAGEPVFDNPSPTAGSGVSRDANERADKSLDLTIDYSSKQGPALIVLPGQVKSNNSSFEAKFGPNNIADFAELELSRANFVVLERADLAPVLSEIETAYAIGDQAAVAKIMNKGRLKTTKWIVKFDILKAEQVAKSKTKIDGRTVRDTIGGIFGRKPPTTPVDKVADSFDSAAAAGVWVIGMRYKIVDANTTEQVAQGYTEEKMEVGAKSTSVAGVSNEAEGGLSLDSMVQRLVKKNVYEIDQKYK